MRQAAIRAHAPDRRSTAYAEDDGDLAARLVAGDVGAFAMLLESYWGPLVAYAGRMLGARDAADDVVQETFIRVWENRARVKPTRSLRGYLYRLTRNLVIDELRRARIRTDRASMLGGEVASPPTPAEVTEADDLGAAATRAIQGLAERRREVFVLAHLHDLSYRQIAEILGITPRTVANHMTLALRQLRAALQPYVDRKLRPH